MFFEGKKVLVTGGTGFIGGHLVSRLKKENAYLCIIDKNIKQKDNYAFIEHHKADLSDISPLREIISNFSPEYIFHLAACNSHEETPGAIDEIRRSNINGTSNILDITKNIRYQRLVFLSSGEVYFGNKAPFKETMDTRPSSYYSKSKIESERECRRHIEDFGKPITILRASVVYGPGQRANMFISSMVKASVDNEPFDMTPGEQTRDFLFVTDLASALMKACASGSAAGQTINIGTGIPTRLSDAVRAMQKLVPGFRANIGARSYRKNEIFEYYFDISKAKKLLGWQPNFSLEKGIKETIEWQKTQK